MMTRMQLTQAGGSLGPGPGPYYFGVTGGVE